MNKRTRLTAAELMAVPTMRTPQQPIASARVHWMDRETAPQSRPDSGEKTRQSDD